MNRNLKFVRDSCKTLLGLGMLIGLAGCTAISGVTLVESSDDLEGVSGQPRWGIVEFPVGARTEAQKRMNTFCTPQKYKVAYERTRTAQEAVPCWIYTGTYIVSCGVNYRIKDYIYIKFECAG